MTDPALLTAVELAARLRSRELSAVEATEAVLARCDRLGPELGPFAFRLDERALAAARRADERLAREGADAPALCGVPATVKDTIFVAGVQSTYGSLAIEGFVPERSAVAVERLEEAGCVIVAKTTNPEFCFHGITESPRHGRTSNPWDTGTVPGGSSGGAGAAVAAGLAPLALGTDGGGSVRIPAAFCGVVGHKPSYGLVPKKPEWDGGWETLSVLGPLARTVADARLMLATMAGADPRDRFSCGGPIPATAQLPALAGVRIAASVDLGGAAPLDDDVRAGFERLIERLVAAGAVIVRDDPGLPSSVRVWTAIAAAQSRWGAVEGGAFEERRELLTPAVIAALEFGERVTAAELVAAENRRTAIHDAYLALFRRTGAEVLLTPALGCEAFRHGATMPATLGGAPVDPEWEDWCGCLYDANLTGMAACALPIGRGADGLPISAQLAGLRGTDDRVLALTAAVEQLVGPAERPPGAFGA